MSKSKPARRPWKPLSAKRLRHIREDAEQDCPEQDYTAAEIYEMASELTKWRTWGAGRTWKDGD